MRQNVFGKIQDGGPLRFVKNFQGANDGAIAINRDQFQPTLVFAGQSLKGIET